MGEKLVCVYAYQIFRGGNTGYIPIFPRGKIWYIIDLPGGNSSMGVKLGCNTGNSFNELKVIVTCISTELCTCIYTTYDQNYKCTDH